MSSRRSICTATGTPNGTLREELGAEDHVNDHEFITDGPPAEQTPQGKKRRASTKAKQGGKPSPKKYRGIRGKLEGMNEMPLDIWHEVCPGCARSSSPLCSKRHLQIFMRLHPIDLVHLSRTSKTLRRHLMSRSSITVWKAARSSVIPSMPACPDDFSEPAYAELAFGKACHVRLHKGIAGFCGFSWFN